MTEYITAYTSFVIIGNPDCYDQEFLDSSSLYFGDFNIPKNLTKLYLENDSLKISEIKSGSSIILKNITDKKLMLQKLNKIKSINQNIYVGFDSDNSYDLSMIAAEIGYDFIVFHHVEGDEDNIFELLCNWDDLTIVPSFLYSNVELSEEILRKYLLSGIDYLCLDDKNFEQSNYFVDKIKKIFSIISLYPHQIENFD